jgi:hypothetical protein
VRIRALLAATASALILAGAFERHYVAAFSFDREALARFYEELPYRKLPGFRRFMEEVRANTREGDHIALLINGTTWQRGYSYGFYRGSYLLAGRTVEPTIDTADRFRPENLAEADHVACWNCTPAVPGFTVRRQLTGGVLDSRR